MSDLINQSGQILVVDGIRINGQSDTPAVSAAKSMIAVGNTPAESVKNEFLNRYRCVAEGEKRILSGTTLTAKVYDSTTGNEVAGISESEFSWSDADGNVIASGINHVTLNAYDHMDGKSEKQFILIWEHPVKYFIGTSERAVTVKQNIFFTLTTDTTKEYMWSTAINEQSLDKTSGLWKTTVAQKPDDGAKYYLWTRVSYDLGITFIYYKSTTYEGPNDPVSHPYNPEADIKLVLDKHYFERQGKKADGSSGDYIPEQQIELTFDYSGVDSDTRVHIYSEENGRVLDAWPKVSDVAYITEGHMGGSPTINIVVEYNGIIVDRVLVSERIITPDFAGKLDTADPKTINGRAPSEGDSFFYINSSGQIILRVYENNKWHDLDGTYTKDENDVGVPNQHFADVMSKALPYIMKRGESLPVSETGPYSFFQNLAAYSAFIENLFVRNLIVSNENADKKVFNATVGMDSVTKKITFKVSYDGKTVFQIDPETGNVFIGNPNEGLTAPASGLMFSPSGNKIMSSGASFTLRDDGTLYTYSMESVDSKFENAQITNGEFTGYFNCYSIKTEREEAEVLHNISINSSDGYYQAYNIAKTMNKIVYSESVNYTEIYGCSFSLSSRVKFCRLQQWSNLGGNYLFQYIALQLFDENRNIVRPSDLGIGYQTRYSGSSSSIDYKSIHIGYWRMSGSDSIDMLDSSYGLSITQSATLIIYNGGNRLVVDIPGVDGYVDPSTISEKGRLYVDSNGFVKAKI